MNAEDDARATWELLSAPERRVLAAVDSRHAVTPSEAGRVVGMTWQRAAQHVRQLRAFRLVDRRNPDSKMVSYELTSQGARCLQAGRAAGPWLVSERPILSNKGWRCPVFRRTESGRADPFTCGDLHVTADLAHECAQREADRRNWPLEKAEVSS